MLSGGMQSLDAEDFYRPSNDPCWNGCDRVEAALTALLLQHGADVNCADVSVSCTHYLDCNPCVVAAVERCWQLTRW